MGSFGVWLTIALDVDGQSVLAGRLLLCVDGRWKPHAGRWWHDHKGGCHYLWLMVVNNLAFFWEVVDDDSSSLPVWGGGRGGGDICFVVIVIVLSCAIVQLLDSGMDSLSWLLFVVVVGSWRTSTAISGMLVATWDGILVGGCGSFSGSRQHHAGDSSFIFSCTTAAVMEVVSRLQLQRNTVAEKQTVPPAILSRLNYVHLGKQV